MSLSFDLLIKTTICGCHACLLMCLWSANTFQSVTLRREAPHRRRSELRPRTWCLGASVTPPRWLSATLWTGVHQAPLSTGFSRHGYWSARCSTNYCPVSEWVNLNTLNESSVCGYSQPRDIYWRRKWQPTPGFLPGESHGQRSLGGYSPSECRVGHGLARTHTQMYVLFFSSQTGKGNKNVFNNGTELPPGWIRGVPSYPQSLRVHSDASPRWCWGLPLLSKHNPFSRVFQTAWKWNVKSGGGHVCVISFISIRFWWLFFFTSPRPQINLTIANQLQRFSLKERGGRKDGMFEQARSGESLFVLCFKCSLSF